MAYFHCLIGGGSSGGGYELTVTCDAQFAGTTITCTDGVTTLTQTCPSASPYEVTFDIPNGGDWTISGVVDGHTVSTGVSIPTSAELIATIQQTVTIHSAKEDTISYIDIDGATQTITFASGATSKQVQIAIEPSGSSITFTSGVAKDPSNLSNYYSKTVTVTENTSSIYLMPDTTLYWYGNNIANISGEAYSFNTGNPAKAPTITFNKNSATISLTGAGNRGIAMSSQTYDLSNFSSMKSVSAITASTYSGYSLAYFDSTPAKTTPYTYYAQVLNEGGGTKTEQLFTKDMSALSTAMYCGFSFLSSGSVSTNGTVTLELKSLWLE